MTVSTVEGEKRFFAASPWLLWISALVIFAVGLGVRLYDLTDPPLDFHPTRQLHSAMMARGMYYQTLTNLDEDWKRELAMQQWKAEGVIEPPIMEYLTGWTYRLFHTEDLWIARLYSIFFWMVGGVFIFLLGRETIGDNGALAALLYFLLLPYGAIASRAFQPDPLMVAAIVAAWWGLARWQRTPTWKWAIIAGLLAGLAIFIKLVAAFFIGMVCVGMVLFGPGLRRAVRDPRVWVLGVLTVLPYACYHVYGMYISGFLQSQLSLRFFPQMWSDPVFYLRWNNELSGVVGFEWLLVALVGTFLVRDRAPRAALALVWVGYFIYGMTLSHHISTHDYYQLPLIPVVALGVAAAVEVGLQHLRGPKPVLYAVVLAVLLATTVLKAWDIRVTLKRNDYRGEVEYWQELGKTIGQGSAVIGLTHDYGYRLAYWGWVNPTNWLTSADFEVRAMAGQEYDMRQEFKRATRGMDFFVVTLMDELAHQPKLKSLLYGNYPVIKEGDGFVIFDLRHPKDEQTPTPAP